MRTSEIFEPYRGRWVSFYPKPENGNQDLKIFSACDVWIGQVVGITFLPNSERGNIPQASLTVRGVKGRTMTINSLKNFVETHRNTDGDQGFKEAYKRLKRERTK